MKRHAFRTVLLLFVSALTLSAADLPAPLLRPNIVIILSDDVGYGDLSSYGATKVSTPHIDALAASGLRFTDGHCTSSTCTPSRYSILTGQYAFRNKKAVILPGNAPLVIDPVGPTLPKVMQAAGYATGFVGKWHLGLGDGNIDWNKTISPGPDELGFDYSYFLPATPDRVPCVYIQDRSVVGLTPNDPLSVNYEHNIGQEPTGQSRPDLLRYPADAQHSGTIVDHISRIGWMAGGHSAWWTDEEMAQQFLSQAQAFVLKNKYRPFFLYYCPHNIHVPRAPNGRFLHTSECGIRGDSIEELDATVGAFLDTLKQAGLAEKTLVIFSSDNGPIFNDGYADGSIKEANGHKPAGPYRGGKYQIFEGGTRVPFIVSWPGTIAPGTSTAMVNQLDLFASLAELAGIPQTAASRSDSQDVLAALLGRSTQGRTTMVEQDSGPTLALREGPWKFFVPVPHAHKKLEEGDTTQGPSPPPGPQLYNLDDDPHEDHNVAAEHPDLVKKMSEELARIRNAGPQA